MTLTSDAVGPPYARSLGTRKPSSRPGRSVRVEGRSLPSSTSLTVHRPRATDRDRARTNLCYITRPVIRAPVHRRQGITAPAARFVIPRRVVGVADARRLGDIEGPHRSMAPEVLGRARSLGRSYRGFVTVLSMASPGIGTRGGRYGRRAPRDVAPAVGALRRRIIPTVSWSWNLEGNPAGDAWYEPQRTVHQRPPDARTELVDRGACTLGAAGWRACRATQTRSAIIRPVSLTRRTTYGAR
jgi:hypothetical protein